MMNYYIVYDEFDRPLIVGTARACAEMNRNVYGFEIDRNFYTRAKNEMLKDYIKE